MRDFSAVPAKQYIGSPLPRPITLGGIQGNCVPLTFIWQQYDINHNPNLAVNVSLEGQQIAAKMPIIKSIYIDNLGCATPVYVYFGDTGYTVAAQPNSAGWFKVYTGGLSFLVVGLGFTFGDTPQTFVLATNADVESSVDLEISQAVALWKGSPVITRGNSILNTNFSAPALGDQTFPLIGGFSAAGVIGTLWGTPYASGFIYLTALQLYYYNVAANLAANGSAELIIESTGISGILYQLPFIYNDNNTGARLANTPLLGPLNALNIKLDATQTWRMRAQNVLNGFNTNFSFITVATVNPT